MRRPLALVVLLVMVAACDTDEYYTGMGTGAIPGDPLYPKPGADATCATVQDTAVADTTLTVADLKGFGWKFDSLKLTTPADLGPLVQGTLDQSIGDGSLVILLVVDSDDRSSGKLTVRLGPGKASGDGFAFDPAPTTQQFTLTGAAMASDTPFDLKVKLGLQLSLSKVAITAHLSASGDAISSGTLAAVYALKDAQADGNDALIKAAADPDLDLDSDGVKESWTIDADFTAATAKVQ